MKLELRHLAPYLPYGLKAEILDNQIKEIRGIGRFKDVSYACFDEMDKANKFDDEFRLEEIKPILHPLSDITEHHAKVVGYSSKEKLIKAIEGQDLNYNNFSELFEEHYDVFGLIDKGLAINKNDL